MAAGLITQDVMPGRIPFGLVIRHMRYREVCHVRSKQQHHIFTQGDIVNTNQKLRIFDLIREAVLPDFRERVAEYLCLYEDAFHNVNTSPEELRASANQLRGYLRGLNTTRVLGMADWEDLDRRIAESWL